MDFENMYVENENIMNLEFEIFIVYL